MLFSACVAVVACFLTTLRLKMIHRFVDFYAPNILRGIHRFGDLYAPNTSSIPGQAFLVSRIVTQKLRINGSLNTTRFKITYRFLGVILHSVKAAH